MPDDDEIFELAAEVWDYYQEHRFKISPLKVHQILTFGTDSDRFLLGLYQRVAAWLDAEAQREEESIKNGKADF